MATRQAIGTIETKGLVAIIEAADAAMKSADVSYAGQSKVGSGLVSATFTGDVAAVKAAMDAAADAAGRVGEVVSVSVIARPHADLDSIQ